MQIRPFQTQDEEAVVSLWQRCDLVRPWNDPRKDIRRKLGVRPDLFLVGPNGIVIDDDNRPLPNSANQYVAHCSWLNQYLDPLPGPRRECCHCVCRG